MRQARSALVALAAALVALVVAITFERELIRRLGLSLIEQLARETDRPERLVTRLGRALWEEHGGTPYLTCVLARLDLDSRSLSWVNAGHPSALLVAGTDHQARPLGRPRESCPTSSTVRARRSSAAGRRWCW